MKAAFTTRYLQATPSPGNGNAAPPASGLGAYADLNLGFRCGDDAKRVAGNWESVLEAEGMRGKTLVLPRMAHGTEMTDVDAWMDTAPSPTQAPAGASPAGKAVQGLRLLEPENTDAVCTRSAGYVLAVTMADCLTALVFDPECGAVAAIHAGWRGTRAGILEKSLHALIGSGRMREESALVAFGPCLRRDSLEVGSEVASQLDPAFVIRREGKTFFDMPGNNRAQALACGIRPERIRDTGGCTLTEPERYFSYRRDGQASGRLAAFISLAPG